MSLTIKNLLRMLSQFHSVPCPLNICPSVFCCVYYIHIHSHHRDKLDPRALKCVFLGYSNSQKGYKCYHPPTGKYYVTMDVQFYQHEPYFFGAVSSILFKGKLIVKREQKIWLDEKRIWISDSLREPMKDS